MLLLRLRVKSRPFCSLHYLINSSLNHKDADYYLYCSMLLYFIIGSLRIYIINLKASSFKEGPINIATIQFYYRLIYHYMLKKIEKLYFFFFENLLICDVFGKRKENHLTWCVFIDLAEKTCLVRHVFFSFIKMHYM